MRYRGGQDYRQHRAGHGALALHVRCDRRPVVQRQVLDVLRQVHVGRGDVSGRVLRVQGRVDGGRYGGGSKIMDQERVQLRQCPESHVDPLRGGNF